MLLLIIFIGICSIAAQPLPWNITTPSPVSPDLSNQKNAATILRRAAVLMEGQQSNRCHLVRSPEIDDKALDLVDLVRKVMRNEEITPEPVNSQEDSRILDPDYCPIQVSIGGRRQLKEITVLIISDLIKRGTSEKTIRSRYNWYNRQYKNYIFQLAQKATNRQKYAEVNSYVKAQFNNRSSERYNQRV